VRYQMASPFLFGSYTEGVVGFFAWVPMLLVVPLAVGRRVASLNLLDRPRFQELFFLCALAQFAVSFLIIANITITAYHYSLEFIPRLALLVVALLLLRSPEFSFDRHAPWQSIALVLTVVLAVNGLYAGHLF
jgi:hypothetical protein